MKKAFTLLELLVVAAIIAVLTVIVVVNFEIAKAKSRDTQRKSDLTKIMNAIVMYGTDHANVLPDSDGYIETSSYGPNCIPNIEACGLHHALTEGKYIDKMPIDPLVSQSANYTGYMYYRGDFDGGNGTPVGTNSDGYLYAVLERPTSADSATMSNALDDLARDSTPVGRSDGLPYNFKITNR